MLSYKRQFSNFKKRAIGFLFNCLITTSTASITLNAQHGFLPKYREKVTSFHQVESTFYSHMVTKLLPSQTIFISWILISNHIRKGTTGLLNFLQTTTITNDINIHTDQTLISLKWGQLISWKNFEHELHWQLYIWSADEF